MLRMEEFTFHPARSYAEALALYQAAREGA